MSQDDWYRFAAFGPYKVPLASGERRIDFDRACEEVFAQAEADPPARRIGNLSQAIGLYVLALSPSGSKRPWPYYVGQACRQTLAERAFQRTDKPRVYGEILKECGYKRAAPLIYLLPLLTPSGRLARRGSNQKIIDTAEYMLIGMAMRTNTDLWNVKERAAMDAFSIDGTPHAYRRRDTNAAKRFRTMMGFTGVQKASGHS